MKTLLTMLFHVGPTIETHLFLPRIATHRHLIPRLWQNLADLNLILVGRFAFLFSLW